MTTPNKIQEAFSLLTENLSEDAAEILNALLWAMVEDVRSSYRLAMEAILTPEQVAEIDETVADYITNHYA